MFDLYGTLQRGGRCGAEDADHLWARTVRGLSRHDAAPAAAQERTEAAELPDVPRSMSDPRGAGGESANCLCRTWSLDGCVLIWYNENIQAAIRAGWIIPNYFKQEDFDEMEGWDQDRLNQFQSYLNRAVCARYDFVRQGIEEVLENFIDEL